MHYDRFLEIYLCTSRYAPSQSLKQIRDGYFADRVNPASYIRARSRSDKTQVAGTAAVISIQDTEISHCESGRLSKLGESIRYVTCLLDVNYVNGSLGKTALSSPIPQLEKLMDWICDDTIVSKLMIAGHGSGATDGEISCAGQRATASQLASILALNGLRKGRDRRSRNMPTAIAGAKWQPDRGNDVCYACDVAIKKGTFLSNKHHCRRCGKVVHDKCSTNRIELEKALTASGNLQERAGKVRVCDKCVAELKAAPVWAAPDPRKAQSLDVGGIRQINLTMCRGAASGQGMGAGDTGFAIGSFAANFVAALRTHNIFGVRVAAANEKLSLPSYGKTAIMIDVPKAGRPPGWRVEENGIPSKTYGFDKSEGQKYIDKSLALSRKHLPGQPIRPVDFQQYEDRVFLIKVSPSGRSLWFGIYTDGDPIEAFTNKMLKDGWDFPRWTETKIPVNEGVFGIVPAPVNVVGQRAYDRMQTRLRNRTAGSLDSMRAQQSRAHQVVRFTMELRPPPGSILRFEELIDVIKIIEGARVPFKDVKVIETT